MNTPTIKEKELRPLNNFIWQRLCEFLPSDKCRGKTQSHILIYGYAAIAMADKSELAQAMKTDDGFFDAMAQIGIDLQNCFTRSYSEKARNVTRKRFNSTVQKLASYQAKSGNKSKLTPTN